jgi:hypothetical protein
MQRRQFLAHSVKLALGARAGVLLSGSLPAVAWATSHSTNLSTADIQTLAVMARALLPHDFLTADDYLMVAVGIDRRVAGDAALRDLIRVGIVQMNAGSDGDWLAAPLDAKLAVLGELQDEAFFSQVLNSAIDTLYRNPAIYRRLGYQGSSIEFGGYLHRGFDDIDWLPAQD